MVSGSGSPLVWEDGVWFNWNVNNKTVRPGGGFRVICAEANYTHRADVCEKDGSCSVSTRVGERIYSRMTKLECTQHCAAWSAPVAFHMGSYCSCRSMECWNFAVRSSDVTLTRTSDECQERHTEPISTTATASKAPTATATATLPATAVPVAPTTTMAAVSTVNSGLHRDEQPVTSSATTTTPSTRHRPNTLTEVILAVAIPIVVSMGLVSFSCRRKIWTAPSQCPTRWAISLQQLEDVEAMAKERFGAEYESMSMYDIVEKLIKPHFCQKYGKSYAMCRNETAPLRAEAFVTHCWAEKFCEFLQEVRSVFCHWRTPPNLWICAFALYQGDSATVQKQLGSDLRLAPFMRALKVSKYFLVMRNSVVDLYERGWCVCEIMFAMEFGFFSEKKSGVFIAGPDTFAQSKISCLDCKTSAIADKQLILLAILRNRRVELIDARIAEFRQFFVGKESNRMAEVGTVPELQHALGTTSN